uniref:DNA-directed DNA polymerase n=1 Tax=Tanacetum cinerariifolium TaxID=118510 RepID=A0A699JLH7_TANCI|nr:DNA-directed DNA polymerase [Tanacetum cinerariifolium]
MIPSTSSSTPPKVVNRETKVTKDTVLPTNNGGTEVIHPPVVQNSEPVVAPVSAPMPNQKTSIPFPSRRNDERRHEKANDQIEKFCKIFRDLSFEISFTDALTLMPNHPKQVTKKLRDPGRFLIPCEFSGINTCNALADLGVSINLMPHSIWTDLSLPELTPTCMTLELADRSITEPIGIAKDVYVTVGKFQFPANFVVVDFEPDPRETNSFLALEDDPTSPKVDDSYYDSEGDILLLEEILNSDPSPPPPNQKNYLPEIQKELMICEAKTVKSSIDEPLEAALIKVLKSYKRAIAWKLSDIKGVDLEFCTHKILMEEDYEPTVQHQRRVNPKIHDVIKKEVEKLLDTGLIYPIFDSPWVSPVHCVPKKGGITVVNNDDNDLIPTRLVTRLCNAPDTFQRWMMAIFYDMIEKTMEVFMDDFSVFGGIVLGHKISKSGIEVDRAKVEVIAKLSHPTIVKGIRSFLGYAGFYRRFIQDFSKIAHSMTHLLEKETPFFFFEECIESFNTLKRKLTKALILIAPDWDLPFELMCDASDFATRAVLRQRKNKHFQPIHYASKTMTEAQTHYTTTEKELLAVSCLVQEHSVH